MNAGSRRAHSAFRTACALDVAVRKPGNVSRASAGHRMQAQQFLASAEAAAGPLTREGARVGERIEAAMNASLAAAGCNTNLGIVLLAAPIARAMERVDGVPSRAELRAAIASELRLLDLEDARRAYRAIAATQPGGLGEAAEQDVHSQPTLDLRAAMGLAADRDRIAFQYAHGYADLFDRALPACPPGLTLSDDFDASVDRCEIHRAVQRIHLLLLSHLADSHIVRKHGPAVAQTVMSAAQAWWLRADAGESLDADPAFAAWDEALKARSINPGTTADLTVATLMLAGCCAPQAQTISASGMDRDTVPRLVVRPVKVDPKADP